MINFKYLLMIAVSILAVWLLFSLGIIGTKHERQASAKPEVFSIHDIDKNGFLNKEEYSVIRIKT